jgi:hypothetical protein
MQNWAEHDENHDRFVKSCLRELAIRPAPVRIVPLPPENAVPPPVVKSAVVQS